MIWVDEEQCKGCGICARVCPDGFEMNGRIPVIRNSNASCINQAISSCPFGAIRSDAEKPVVGQSRYNEANRPFLNVWGMGRGMGIGRGRGGGLGIGRGRGGSPRGGRGGGGRW